MLYPAAHTWEPGDCPFESLRGKLTGSGRKGLALPGAAAGIHPTSGSPALLLPGRFGWLF